ncbi:MAG: hypothetical protein WD928_13380 [Gammaproteobacteria bacterium]
MRLLVILLLGCLSCTPAVLADPVLPTLSAEQARAFTRGRIADGYELLFGPSRPAPLAPSTLDCQALYARRLELMRAGLDYRAQYWDDPRHAAAIFVGTLWTPAFYYLPYRAVAATAAAARRHGVDAELDQLRHAAASRRCFDR